MKAERAIPYAALLLFLDAAAALSLDADQQWIGCEIFCNASAEEVVTAFEHTSAADYCEVAKVSDIKL
eukprot:4497-Heterococcus_DN1.PRE.4